VRRWHARIDYITSAKGLRHWEGEVEAATAERAIELAVQAFRLTRFGLQIPEIADIRLWRVKGSCAWCT
jgi:hypothetical protein